MVTSSEIKSSSINVRMKSKSGWLADAMNGKTPLLDEAQPEFERVLIRAALKRTQGHRQEAAKLLGWGRNTLTRKLKELAMDDIDDQD